MSNWKEYKFSEILVNETISYGVVQPGFHKSDGIPIIRVNNIKSGCIIVDDIMKIDLSIEKKHIKTRLEGGELLITLVGSVGECAIVPDALKGWNVARAVSVARIKQNFDKRFIKYSFQLEEIKHQLYGNTNDTVQPTLNLSSLKEITLKCPSLSEQKAIAEVLSSLDDKIDLLHRQNQTLEQLAESHFRHLFIDNAQDDWEEKPLKDVCLIRNGFAFKSETYQESGQKIIRTTNFSNGFVELCNDVVFISNELAESFSAYHLDRKDFLLVMVGASLGNFAVVTKDILPALQNQNMWCFRSKKDDFQYYLNHAIRIIIAENLHSASGSARSFFQKGSFYEQLIKVPDAGSINEFNSLSEDIFSKLESNRSQIKNLEKLRDQLLPKLMNGENDMGDLCTK